MIENCWISIWCCAEQKQGRHSANEAPNETIPNWLYKQGLLPTKDKEILPTTWCCNQPAEFQQCKQVTTISMMTLKEILFSNTSFQLSFLVYLINISWVLELGARQIYCVSSAWKKTIQYQPQWFESSNIKVKITKLAEPTTNGPFLFTLPWYL